MNAELITIGTELLLGQIVDSNAAWLAQQLAAAGVNLFRKTTVGDNHERTAAAILEALTRCDLVITTGGLGPTVDDVTREAIATATNRPLIQRPELVAQVEAIFARWGRQAGANNLRQAELPEGAEAIDNPIGTAPGIRLQLASGQSILALPGVPHEMKRMFSEQVLPFIRSQGVHAIIKSKVLRTAAMGESVIDEKLTELERLSNPTIGLAAHLGQVDIRITAKASSEREADELISFVEAQVRKRIGESIFGEGDITLEATVAKELSKQPYSLAIQETWTNGAIAQVLQQAQVNVLHHGRTEAGSLPSEEEAIHHARMLASHHRATIGLIIFSTDGDHAYGQNPGESLLVAASRDHHLAWRYAQIGRDDTSRAWLTVRTLELLRRLAKQMDSESKAL